MSTTSKRAVIAIAVVLFILLIDQLLKIWVKTNMTLGESIPMFGDWFNIYFTENKGMAFGLEFGQADIWKLLLSLFRIVAVFAISWFIYKLIRKSEAPVALIICISMILAGALGNIIDSAIYGLIFSESTPFQAATMFPEGGGYERFLHGKVVDMLQVRLLEGRFPDWLPFWGGDDFLFFRPIFNVADSAITTGVAIILVFQKRFFKTEHTEEQKVAHKHESTEVLEPSSGEENVSL